MAQVDKIILLNGIKTGTNREYVHFCIGIMAILVAFQADDEGSIPFTRSNVFNHLTVVPLPG